MTMTTTSTEITFVGVGDVFLDRPEPADAFDAVQPVLDAADVRFANHGRAQADLLLVAVLPIGIGRCGRYQRD